MRHSTNIVLACVAIFACAVVPRAGADPDTTVLTDGDFANWTFGQLSSPGSSATAERVGDGGNLGACIQVTTLTGGTAYAISLDGTWNPATQGAILDVGMGMDVYSVSGWGQGQGIKLTVAQGGNYYVAPSSYVYTYTQTSWFTVAVGSFSATDFYRWLAPETLGSEHPDFSASATPLTFGFSAGNTRSGTYTQLYDNWSLTINYTPPPPSGGGEVPEPFSLAFMGSAFIGLVGWRSRRRGRTTRSEGQVLISD
jgi:hypothetical protein